MKQTILDWFWGFVVIVIVLSCFVLFCFQYLFVCLFVCYFYSLCMHRNIHYTDHRHHFLLITQNSVFGWISFFLNSIDVLSFYDMLNSKIISYTISKSGYAIFSDLIRHMRAKYWAFCHLLFFFYTKRYSFARSIDLFCLDTNIDRDFIKASRIVDKI